MKTLKLIFIMSIMVKCQAQSPVYNIAIEHSFETGVYNKDVNNLLNQFEGTYLYTNGTTTFKIQLVKKVQQFNGKYYEDLIIGEYQYIVNGVEKINTLAQINTVYNDQKKHSIFCSTIIKNNDRGWKCPECAVDEKRLRASIRDTSSDRFAELYIRKIMVGNQEAIKIKISHVTGVTYLAGGPAPLEFTLPQGEFTLIKQ